MKLSVVIPIYNEEENVNPLYEELKGVLETLEYEHEIIFIDDGSKDTSLVLLEKIQQQDSDVVVISFRRNFGQTAAMSAGFDYARGNIIIPMDADLQNDPKDIPRLIAKMEAKGIKVHPVWFDEHNQRDGSIRCATQQLLRIPTKDW